MDTQPLRFIGEAVQVSFDVPPTFEKSPTCPSAFIWKDKTYRVSQLLAEWHDFSRHGRMGRNMRPVHAERASVIGSWGVGRFYFRVMVADGRIFELYYDRAPKDAFDRKGYWILFGERAQVEEE
jgi:hypothetical protein